MALREFCIEDYDIDDFFDTNIDIFNKQEEFYMKSNKYKVISLLCIALMDLQLIEFEDE